MFKAAIELEDLINAKGQHVYLHCNTGISRSPTLLLVYWALFLRHDCWDDPDEMAAFIKQNYELSMPNMKVVKQVIAHNNAFI